MHTINKRNDSPFSKYLKPKNTRNSQCSKYITRSKFFYMSRNSNNLAVMIFCYKVDVKKLFKV